MARNQSGGTEESKSAAEARERLEKFAQEMPEVVAGFGDLSARMTALEESMSLYRQQSEVMAAEIRELNQHGDIREAMAELLATISGALIDCPGIGEEWKVEINEAVTVLRDAVGGE